jgi:acetyl-CoA carboxylase carboxyl transferase subunit beta
MTGAVARAAGATPELWVKCLECSALAFRKEVERNLNVCLKCGFHFPLTVEQRLVIVADRGSWRQIDAVLFAVDALGFVDSKPYLQRLTQTRAAVGRYDAITTGLCEIEGQPVALGIMDFQFMGGSMGVVVGEKLARLFAHAGRSRLPTVIFCASGGARMQEGILALMQMAKVVSALARYRELRLPYVSVLCHPTTGGVAASFAMLGDLNLAEPGAIIGFAGRRVIEQTTPQALPEDFQRAESLLSHGMVDAIVTRRKLRPTLNSLLAMLGRFSANRSRRRPKN